MEKEREKLSIKFHVEGNKVVFDETCIVINGDSIIFESFMDDEGVVHYTHVFLEREILASPGKLRGWMELTKDGLKEGELEND